MQSFILLAEAWKNSASGQNRNRTTQNWCFLNGTIICVEFLLAFDEDKPYAVPERGNRVVKYAEKKELLNAILCKYRPDLLKESVGEGVASNNKVEETKPAGNSNQSHGREIHQANEEKGKAGSKVVRTTAPANRVAKQEGLENA